MKKKANKAFHIERTFNAPVEKIWRALTDKEYMKLWYFNLKEFEAKKGFYFEFSGGPSPENQYLHQCEVLEVIPLKKLKHSWKYKGYEGVSFLTFELEDLGDKKTKLSLWHEGLESFPNISDFARENFEAGWNEIINTSLKNYLEAN